MDGTVCGLKYNGTAYYFYKNLQGDVIAITDDSGTVVARYFYDAWDVCTIESDTTADNIATINPFRYRGYYYDTETSLYYLQSRYHNPAVGGFINRDNIKYIGKSRLFNNLYCYCINNPVCNVDFNGILAGWIIGITIGIGVAVLVLGFAFLTQDFNKIGIPDSPNGAEYELYLKVELSRKVQSKNSLKNFFG